MNELHSPLDCLLNMNRIRFLVLFLALGCYCDLVFAQAAEPEPSIQVWVEQYTADMATLNKRFRVPLDHAASERRMSVMNNWLTRLHKLDFSKLDRVGQTDFLLLKSEINYAIEKHRLDTERDTAAAEWLPYADQLVDFCKSREDVEPIDASAIAVQLDQTAAEIEALVASIGPTPTATNAQDVQRRLDALRASELVQELARSTNEAHQFYDGYHPHYSWWCKMPMQRLSAALAAHRTALRDKVVGVPESDKETIIGLPIGREGLAVELRHEWIAHEPAELVALAEREMAWCDEQMRLASQQLGCGDDWRRAMELVKAKHVEPGDQPQMIRDLAWEAIRFLEAHDLVTVPPLAADGSRMTMMRARTAKVNPYFLGGDMIIVSFPTDTMTQAEKMMSMRVTTNTFHAPPCITS